jgi:predicted flap endonuclease-1-like 5' DNA nuclease
MNFLLAKIAFLLLAALALGVWWGRWSARRRFQDVTTEYNHLRADWQTWRQNLEARLAAPTAINLQPLATRMDELGASLRAIRIPPAANLQPFQAQLEVLEEAVRAIRIPQPVATDLSPVLAAVSGIQFPPPPVVDLQPLQAQLRSLDEALRAIHLPQPEATDLGPVLAAVSGIRIPQPQAVDLQPLHSELKTLGEAVRAIHVPPPVATDLGPVLAAVSAIRLPQPQVVDVQPLQAQIKALEDAVRAIRIPASTTVDLQPVLEQLAAVQSRLATPPPPPPAPPPSAHVRAGSRNLLTQAAYGKPDDLKAIKGVATVMEKMLHDIGVYYFWQIAEWTPADVAHADAQLSAFHGRIERDDWVSQALVLAAAAGAAPKPDL